jgi:small subunit ribosomal protein S13
MARIAGVDIPKKRGVIALTYIFGLGKSRAIEILEKAQVSKIKVQDWNDDEIGRFVKQYLFSKLKENYVLRFL